ncbi:MAG: phenylalanine--tRNA ligase subunit beta [Candidatus Pacebacteria bacterium]|nr:phenylalanine--tRNA ligase subunit beta [Candidatus Paceibacterota bacterium]
MKFSFSLIKKLAPGKYTKQDLIEKLNIYSFEAVDFGEDVIEIGVSANRYSDAASHIGIAREVATIYGTPLKLPDIDSLKFDFKNTGVFTVSVKDAKMCPRYMAAYVTDVKVGPSPDWMKDVLESCGLRPINNVVDIMNYVMLEIGQPMHAFDADKVKGGIIVRHAEEKEKIKTLDGGDFTLSKHNLVIADNDRALAIAGIKGGEFSGVTMKTARLLVEAANFDGTGIYNSSRLLNLKTDASLRFAHNLSPALAEMGIKRALKLLKDLAGAKIYKIDDVYPKKQAKEVIKLDLAKLEKFIGAQFKPAEVSKTLKSLGFAQMKDLWSVPLVRADVVNFEDLAEEVARFSDYNKLEYVPPHIALGIAEEDEEIILKDKIRKFFTAAGFSEVYNYSFSSKEEVSAAPRIFGDNEPVVLANPMSNQFAFMRDSLCPAIVKNLKSNSRFYDEVRIFEIGNIFGKAVDGSVVEKLAIGAGIIAKNGLFEMKGLADALFSQLGLTDYSMIDLNFPSKLLKTSEALRIETDHTVLGYLGTANGTRKAAVLEFDLEKLMNAVTEEREYEPISKYPAVERDLSILISNEIRVGKILELIQSVNAQLIRDVDLIDFYENDELGENKKSLTFRIVFQADDRTLTDEEVNKEMAIVSKVVEDEFNAELR